MKSVRCPDCGVTMEETTVRVGNGTGVRIETGKRDGLLGKLGVGTMVNLRGVCCSECGLVRLYAPLEDEN